MKKDRFNLDHVAHIEPKVVPTYEAAKQHAESDYWVKPVLVSDSRAASAFALHYKVGDVATSGQVHYTKK